MRPKAKRSVVLIRESPEIQMARCFDWSTGGNEPNLVAVGQTNGCVLLASVGGSPSSKSSVRNIYTPKHPRQCNAVAWNTALPNLLAAGFDRVRFDHACFVWDLNEAGTKQSSEDSARLTDTTLAEGGSSQPIGLPERYSLSPATVAEYVMQPKASLASLGETSCLAWLPDSPHCLMVGTKSRWIRMYDIRQGPDAVASISLSRAVHGLCFSPARPHCMATFSGEPGIRLWDVRSFKEPLLQLATGGHPLEISWCPARGNLLGSITKEETCIRVYDIANDEVSQQQETGGGRPLSVGKSGAVKDAKGDDGGNSSAAHAYCHRSDIYEVRETISSFCWRSGKLQLFSLNADCSLDVTSIRKPTAISFSNLSRFCLGSGSQLAEGPILSNVDPIGADSSSFSPVAASSSQATDDSSDKDISLVMYARAARGYDGDAKFNRVLARSFNNPDVLFAWRWLCNVKYNVLKKSADFCGIHSIISHSKSSQMASNPQLLATATEDSESTESGSSSSYVNLNPSNEIIMATRREETSLGCATDVDLPAVAYLKSIHVAYTSSERLLSLRLCGWGFVSREEFQSNIDMLVDAGLVTKAIAIALFHLEIQTALSILHTGGAAMDPNLKLVDMALAGLSETPSALWKSSLQSLKNQATDTYLIAIASFLCKTSEQDDYRDILVECEISLRDKIAFACRYLDDEKLKFYLDATKVKMVEMGRLTGIILTGIDWTGGGIDLLQEYINRTSDIQTVALLLCHTPHRKNEFESRPLHWVNIYRQLLNRWKMWTERAHLEVLRGVSLGTIPVPHVVVRCNICNTPLNASKSYLTHFKVAAPMDMKLTNREGILSTTASLPIGNKVSPDVLVPTKQGKKTTACPSCHKRLPRCALCLLPLACTVPTISNLRPHGTSTPDTGTQAFDDWFSWCQTCKHGGHAKHLLSWFEENSICPVADCNCRCLSAAK